MERNSFPTEIQNYIKQLYDKTKSVVTTKNFKTNIFSFSRGVLQGGPNSTLLFLLAFDPILKYLESKKKLGYKIIDKDQKETAHTQERDNIKTHTNSIHNKIKDFTCNKCDANFALKSELNGQMDAVHTQEKDNTKTHTNSTHNKIKDSKTSKDELSLHRSYVYNRVGLTAHVKNMVKKNILEEENLKGIEKLKELIQQGNLLALAAEEEKNFEWKSYCFNLKKGTLKFILNSRIDTLPHRTNLLKWGKCPTNKCEHCGAQETTMHILNGCKIFLEQGRFTWRHDNIVSFISECLDTAKYEAYADVPGKRYESGGTIPPKLTITADRQDIVIIDDARKIAKIYELTVPLEPNIHKSHEYKQDKYAYFQTDCQDHNVDIKAFEIGSRGYITKENEKRLKELYQFCTKEGMTFKSFRDKISCLAISSSYYIFVTRKEKDWAAPPRMKPSI